MGSRARPPRRLPGRDAAARADRDARRSGPHAALADGALHTRARARAGRDRGARRARRALASTLSARMEQEGRTVALVLSAFSVPWSGPELDDLPLPEVEGPEPGREAGTAERFGLPPFTQHIVLQPRFQGMPLTGERRPMEVGGWLGLAEPRPLDHLALAFFSDALLPSPFMATGEPAAAPTIDLTVHFRSSLRRPRGSARALLRAGLVQARTRGLLRGGRRDLGRRRDRARAVAPARDPAAADPLGSPHARLHSQVHR